MRGLTAAACLGLLGACATETEGDLALLGAYREPGDPCRWVSPTPDTAKLMQLDADLVACPAGYDGIPTFVTDVKATEVARMSGHVLFRVPHP